MNKLCAIHSFQNPLTGDSEQIILQIDESTTIGEIIKWQKENSLGITEYQRNNFKTNYVSFNVRPHLIIN